ncbi:MAG: hypothetical protein ACERKD_20700 [Prolixibacteraceae bacterium]
MRTQLITLAALLLFSLSISANNNSSNRNDEVNVSEITNVSFNSETALNIEKWMTDDQIWKPASIQLEMDKVSVEESLEIEEWMTNSELWSRNANKVDLDFSSTFENDEEEPLSIENWMTNDSEWNM